MSVDLHLAGSYTPPVGRADLHIGRGGDDRLATVQARSGGATLAGRIYHTHRGTVSARSAGARLIVRAAYDPNLLSDDVAVRASFWSDAESATAAPRIRFSEAPKGQGAAALRWSPAASKLGAVGITWRAAERINGSTSSTWGGAERVASMSITSWRQAPRGVGSGSTAWRDAALALALARGGWVQLDRGVAELVSSWMDGARLDADLHSGYGDGARIDLEFSSTWRDAGYPPYRIRLPIIPPHVDPWVPPGTHLCLIRDLPGTALHIGLVCPGPPSPGALVIPIQRVYRVINTVTLVRVSDGAEIPITGLTLSIDSSSWAWTWSCTAPVSMLSRLVTNGQPEELLATLNGKGIRLLVDSISRARAFGSSSLSLSGRGRAAVLAAPRAKSTNRINTIDLTARQLLDDALTDNGVSIGWSLDWRVDDWLVPAGSWIELGTSIYAAMRIARAAGGYVQGHDTDATLIIQPDYPVPPWEWADATPNLVLPEDVCRTESVEWVELDDYNAVWVTGGPNGRRDYVRRDGTDGLKLAPTVANWLATAEAMTRQVGTSILSNTGKQVMISVVLPVLDETWIIKPGLLVDYTENGVTHRGITRAVQVECGFPEIWQTVKIEARS